MGDHIVIAAEQVFNVYGFAGSGIDRLAKAAGVSSRTLYKHMGSKSGLITAVLESREERFRQAFEVGTLDELFDALEKWTLVEGARGCLFLRALGENGESDSGVSTAVAQYRDHLFEVMLRVVTTEVGAADKSLAEQLLVLFEGATSAASYHGISAIAAARTAAHSLVGNRQIPTSDHDS